MSSMVYLIKRQMVNGFKELMKKPGKVIFYVFFLGLLIWMIFQFGSGKHMRSDRLQSDQVFLAISMAVIVAYIALFLYSSTKGTVSFFRSSDVNFLFSGPFKASQVLIYGFLKQVATTIIPLLAWVYQYPNLTINFNLKPNAIGIMLGTLLLLQLFTSVLSMLIFAFSTRSPRLRHIFDRIFQGLGLLILSGYGVYLWQYKDILPAAQAFFGASFFQYIPVIGWFGTMLGSMVKGVDYRSIISLFLVMASCALLLGIFFRMNNNFYEGAAQATENKEVRLAKVKSGKNAVFHQNSKVHKAHIQYQSGAWAIFSRHLLEHKKQGVGIFSKHLILYGMLGFVVSSTLKKEATWVLYCGLYFSLLMVEAGPWSTEMARPWFFLIPDNPFKKMVAATGIEHLNNFLNAVAFFGVIGIAQKLNPLLILALVMTYVTGNALILYLGIAIKRSAGGEIGRVIFRIIRLIAGAILIGIGVGISFMISYAAFSKGNLIMALTMQIIYNTALSAGMIYVSRDFAVKMEWQ